jgi:hypothetical protein
VEPLPERHPVFKPSSSSPALPPRLVPRASKHCQPEPLDPWRHSYHSVMVPFGRQSMMLSPAGWHTQSSGLKAADAELGAPSGSSTLARATRVTIQDRRERRAQDPFDRCRGFNGSPFVGGIPHPRRRKRWQSNGIASQVEAYGPRSRPLYRPERAGLVFRKGLAELAAVRTLH